MVMKRAAKSFLLNFPNFLCINQLISVSLIEQFVTPLYTLLGYRQLKGAFVFNISALMIELIFQLSDKKYVPVIDVSNTSGSAYMYLHLNYKASAGRIYR